MTKYVSHFNMVPTNEYLEQLNMPIIPLILLWKGNKMS
jgi:hypothetical protein